MSDVAASGGYYIAMPCDTIIAHPATITDPSASSP